MNMIDNFDNFSLLIGNVKLQQWEFNFDNYQGLKGSTSAENTAARLAQLGERRSAEREAVGSNPGRTNTQGL